MTTILVVDDSNAKRDQVVRVLSDALGVAHIHVDTARNAAEAVSLLEKNVFDLLILDINIPLRRDSDPVRDGGLRLLKQLQQGGPRLNRPAHIIGLTEYPELYRDFSREFASHNWQIVQYDAAETAWAQILTNKAIYIAEVNKRFNQSNESRTDLAIVTALKTIELEAVLNLDANWSELPLAGDDTIYHIGTFRRDSVSLSVVAAAAFEMGMAATACLSMKLIQHFRPRYIFMAGITAGIGAEFGDIVVADQAWDYGSGKLLTLPDNTSQFAPAPSYLPLDPSLKERIELFRTRRKSILHGIQTRWPGNETKHSLSLKMGPVASGAAVIENRAALDGITAHNRKVVGVEMETYGLFLACHVAPVPRPVAVSAKSVCDFGVPPKTDEYQKYAAFTSANFIFEFALDQITSSSSQQGVRV
jgi:nucleoside phosphorylase/CheY-like chemotaxis protein